MQYVLSSWSLKFASSMRYITFHVAIQKKNKSVKFIELGGTRYQASSSNPAVKNFLSKNLQTLIPKQVFDFLTVFT